MELKRRIRRNTFPLYEVTKARKIPGGIEVQIIYPIGEQLINSPWMSADPKSYYRNGKKYSIRTITDELCYGLKGASMRIPKLEKEHHNSIRKEQLKIYKRR